MREIHQPAQHLAAKPATARGLAGDQIVHIQEFSPCEIFKDAESGATDAFTVGLQPGEAITRGLLPLPARQERLRREMRPEFDKSREARGDLRVGFSKCRLHLMKMG